MTHSMIKLGDQIWLGGLGTHHRAEDIEKDVLLALIGSEGLQFGFGIFETLKVRNGRTIHLKEHLNRLIRSASVLGIAYEAFATFVEGKAFQEIMADLFEKEEIAVLKIMLMKRRQGESFWILLKKPYLYKEETYMNGFSCRLGGKLRNENSHWIFHKTMNCGENLAMKQSLEVTNSEWLWRNSKGDLTEGSVSNVFIKRGNRWFTPEIKSGLLNGVTRQKLIEHLQQSGIEVVEACFGPEVLYQADRVYLTNSLMGLMPVRFFEQVKFEVDMDEVWRLNKILEIW